jgi:hypothetical protein
MLRKLLNFDGKEEYVVRGFVVTRLWGLDSSVVERWELRSLVRLVNLYFGIQVPISGWCQRALFLMRENPHPFLLSEHTSPFLF